MSLMRVKEELTSRLSSSDRDHASLTAPGCFAFGRHRHLVNQHDSPGLFGLFKLLVSLLHPVCRLYLPRLGVL